MAVAVERDWEIEHVDVVGAYLNSELEETIYMKIPEGVDGDVQNYVCRLNKSLYMLKQAGINWCDFLSNVMENLGFMSAIHVSL